MSDANVVSDVIGAAGYSKRAKPCKPAGRMVENRRKRWSAAAFVCALFSVATIAAGCGSAASSAPSGPISASQKFDISDTSAPQGIRDAYAGAAVALMDAIVARGGTLHIGAFRGAAVEVATLEGDPAVSSARRERDLDGAGALSAVASEVEGALGLAKPSPGLAAKLDTLSPGSAVAAALRLAVEDVRAATGERLAVVVSDGRDNALPDGVRDDDASAGPRALAEVLSEELGELDASGVTVVMVGIGQGLSAARAARLIEAWRIVCRATNAAQCIVDADPGAVAEVVA